MLTPGPVPPNPAELIGSEEMRKLLGELGKRFAHIIIDSPPAISFYGCLNSIYHGGWCCARGSRWQKFACCRQTGQTTVTRRRALTFSGVVLNNVKKFDTQGILYYSGYYSKYYADADTSDPDTGNRRARLD